MLTINFFEEFMKNIFFIISLTPMIITLSACGDFETFEETRSWVVPGKTRGGAGHGSTGDSPERYQANLEKRLHVLQAMLVTASDPIKDKMLLENIKSLKDKHLGKMDDDFVANYQRRIEQIDDFIARGIMEYYSFSFERLKPLFGGEPTKQDDKDLLEFYENFLKPQESSHVRGKNYDYDQIKKTVSDTIEIAKLVVEAKKTTTDIAKIRTEVSKKLEARIKNKDAAENEIEIKAQIKAIEEALQTLRAKNPISKSSYEYAMKPLSFEGK